MLNSSIKLEIQDSNGKWITVNTFNASSMYQDKDLMRNYSTEIPFAVKAFRFIIITN